MTAKVLIDTLFPACKVKDATVLSDVFNEDAVFVTHSGATYRGLAQIQEYFKTLFFEGEIRAWDVKRLLDETAVEWYYKYQFNYAGSVSYDGVSLFEIRNGKISLWRDFIQAAKRTYPLEVKDIGVAEKLQDALDDLISLLPAETMQPEE